MKISKFTSRFSASLKLLVLFTLLALSTETRAYPNLMRAQPPPAGTVTNPLQVDLWFSEPVRDAGTEITVFPVEEMNLNANERTNVIRDAPAIDPRNPTHVFAELWPLPAGDYVLNWKAAPRNNAPPASGWYKFHVADFL